MGEEVLVGKEIACGGVWPEPTKVGTPTLFAESWGGEVALLIGWGSRKRVGGCGIVPHAGPRVLGRLEDGGGGVDTDAEGAGWLVR